MSNRAAKSGVTRTRRRKSCPTPNHTATHLKLLGVTFDCKLRMDPCVRETVSQASGS